MRRGPAAHPVEHPLAFPGGIRSLQLAVIRRRWGVLGALALGLMACGGDETSPAVPGSPGPEVSEAQARSLYIRKCSLCHGDDGKLMASKSPDLSVSTLTLAERVAIITYGKGTMPAQKGVLNKAEIKAVASYIDRFRD